MAGLIESISPSEFLADRSAVGLLIDVRTPAEFASGCAKDAVNIPLDQLSEEGVRRVCGERKPYFICRSGARGEEACRRMATCGLQAANIQGGLAAWEKAGGPLLAGTSTTISLERQVRIAAGSLVVLGIVLAAGISPWFLLLSLFVGGGLIFSGVTNTCGMALVLARMPWNH